MSNNTLKIKVPLAETRESVTTMKDWGKFFTETELVEIVHRYCNTQDGSKKYRLKASEEVKALKAFAKKNPDLFKS